MLDEPIAVTLQVVDVLEQLDVPYAIGGSLASTLHGVMRATLDADLVAALQPHHAAPLAQALRAAFDFFGEGLGRGASEVGTK